MLDATTTTMVLLPLYCVRVVSTEIDAVVTLAGSPEEPDAPVVSGTEKDGADDAEAVAFVVGRREDAVDVAFANNGAEPDDADVLFELGPVVRGTEAVAVALLKEAGADDDPPTAALVAVVLA